MNHHVKVDVYGNKRYYVNNVLHREDGPAVEYANGDKWWYKNGELHREDGPALEWVSGYKAWYLNGKFYGKNDVFTDGSWKRFVKTLIFA